MPKFLNDSLYAKNLYCNYAMSENFKMSWKEAICIFCFGSCGSWDIEIPKKCERNLIRCFVTTTLMYLVASQFDA